MATINDKIDEIYVENNYPGLEKLIKLVRAKHPDITREQVKKFHDEEVAAQLVKVQKKTKSTGHIVALNVNEKWFLDIFDLQKYAPKNDGNKYILCAIDVYTRKAYIEPMKNKESKTCAEAFEAIIKKAGASPRTLISDREGGFLHDTFQKVIEKHEITFTQNIKDDHRLMGIIDNFAKRLKLALTVYFVRSKTTSWLQAAQKIVDNYNKSQNSALNNLTPNEAQKKENDETLFKLNFDKIEYNRTVSDLKAGDKVRIDVREKQQKGTDPRWSDEVYEVVKVNGQTITLSNDQAYKRYQLLKVPATAKTTYTNIVRLAKKYKTLL